MAKPAQGADHCITQCTCYPITVPLPPTCQTPHAARWVQKVSMNGIHESSSTPAIQEPHPCSMCTVQTCAHANQGGKEPDFSPKVFASVKCPPHHLPLHLHHMAKRVLWPLYMQLAQCRPQGACCTWSVCLSHQNHSHKHTIHTLPPPTKPPPCRPSHAFKHIAIASCFVVPTCCLPLVEEKPSCPFLTPHRAQTSEP